MSEQVFETPAPVEEALPEEGQQATMSLPMQDLVITGSQIGVIRNPDSPDDRLLVIGPIVLRIVVPLQAEVARMVARDLAGGIVPVSGFDKAELAEAAARVLKR